MTCPTSCSPRIPELQAYRTDTITEIEPICPAGDGDLFCDQVSWEGVLALRPLSGGGAGGGSDTTSPGLTGLVGLLIGFGGGLLVARRRRGGGGEPLELPE